VTFFITAVASAPFEFDPPAMGFAIQSLRIFGPLGGPKAENLEKLNQLKEDFKKNLQGIDNVSHISKPWAYLLQTVADYSRLL
jgi:hypothetical protein